MFNNYTAALAKTLKWEGGYSNNPKDPGGATMHGVTQRTYNHFRAKFSLPPRDVRDITATEIQAIYQPEYWDASHCNQLVSGVDLVVFDAAVNSGVTRAHGWLQAALGGTAVQTVQRFSAKRLGFLHNLRTWAVFGKGWAPRVADMEATGVKWAAGSKAPEVLQKAGQDAQVKAQRHSGAATATVASTAAPWSIHDVPWYGWFIIGLIGLVLVSVFAYYYHIHTVRAKAFETAAKEA